MRSPLWLWDFWIKYSASNSFSSHESFATEAVAFRYLRDGNTIDACIHVRYACQINTYVYVEHSSERCFFSNRMLFVKLNIIKYIVYLILIVCDQIDLY